LLSSAPGESQSEVPLGLKLVAEFDDDHGQVSFQLVKRFTDHIKIRH
jgi:hypothetical protein